MAQLNDTTINGALTVNNGTETIDVQEQINDLNTNLTEHESTINDLSSTLSNKQDKITGAATTLTDSNLTASRALISNSSGKVAVSAVTSTELGYLDGVTSSVQTQLNKKLQASAYSASAFNGTITLSNGFKMAWGRVASTSFTRDGDVGAYSCTVSLSSYAFTTTPIVIATGYYPNGVPLVSIKGTTTTSVTLTLPVNSAGNCYVNWLAIGK